MLKRLVCLLLTATVAQAQMAVTQVQDRGAVSAAKQKRVTLDMQNVPVKQILDAIAQQIGARTLYSSGVVNLDTKATVNLKNATVDQAIVAAVRGTKLDVRVTPGGETIVVGRKTTTPPAQGVITGTVTDSKTGKGISGAGVSLNGETRSVFTGEDGSYRLSAVTAGQHAVAVRLVGYAKQTRMVTVGEGATVTADFKLEPSTNVLDQVIVTGTVVQTELKAVPSAITVITAKQIEERGITRIDQLFRGDIPGLFAQNTGSNNLLDAVSMFSRGGTSLQMSTASSAPATNPIKTYVDGVELADAKYLSQIDPRSIERIEILTGPQASTIYGSNAINGVMQVFTKRGVTTRPQFTLNMMTGLVQNNFTPALSPVHSYNTAVSGSEGHWSYNVGCSWDYTSAWTPAKRTERISGYGSGRMQTGSVTADLSFRQGFTRNLQRGSTGQVATVLQQTGARSPTASAGVSSPSVSALTGRTAGLTVGFAPTTWWSHELMFGSDVSNGETSTSAPAYTTFPAGGDTLLSFSQSYNTRVSQRYTTTVRIPITSLFNATLTSGVDHWRSTGSSSQASGTSLVGSLGDPTVTRNRPSKNAGGFVQGQVGVSDALFFTYGIRAEWNPNYGDDAQPNLAPRFGVAYTRDIGPVTTKLRGSYGRSTRPPTEDQKKADPLSPLSTNIREVFGQFDTRLANPDLGPESQQGGEGGIELYFSNKGSLIVTRYNQTVDNLIASTIADSIPSLGASPSATVCSNGGGRSQPDGSCYYLQLSNFNVGSIRNQGWELQGSMNLGPFTTRGTYSWNKSRMIGITQKYRERFTGFILVQPGATFNFLPEHTWSTNIGYALGRTALSLNVNGVGQLHPYTLTGWLNNQTAFLRLQIVRPRMNVPTGYRETASGYATADLNASHRLSSSVEGTLQILNLGDFYRNDSQFAFATLGRQTKLGLRIRM